MRGIVWLHDRKKSNWRRQRGTNWKVTKRKGEDEWEHEGNEGKQIRKELMKGICWSLKRWPVFVFLSPDITNCYKLFEGSNCIFEPPLCIPVLVSHAKCPSVNREPNLTSPRLVKHLNLISAWGSCPRALVFLSGHWEGKTSWCILCLLILFHNPPKKAGNISGQTPLLHANGSLGLELFLKTKAMWQDKTGERILNECFVSVIIAVERWRTSAEVHYKRYKELYEKSTWAIRQSFDEMSCLNWLVVISYFFLKTNGDKAIYNKYSAQYHLFKKLIFWSFSQWM